MSGCNWIMRLVAVFLLLFSLGTSPVTLALTHGPAAIAAEADHAAWHAEKDAVWQAHGHQHRDSTDHDHSTFVVLGAQQTAIFNLTVVIELNDLPILNEAIGDGLRRPPRDAA